MAERPPQPLSTAGGIRTLRTETGWVAPGRDRNADRKTRQLLRTGRTKAQAERRLEQASGPAAADPWGRHPHRGRDGVVAKPAENRVDLVIKQGEYANFEFAFTDDSGEPLDIEEAHAHISRYRRASSFWVGWRWGVTTRPEGCRWARADGRGIVVRVNATADPSRGRHASALVSSLVSGWKQSVPRLGPDRLPELVNRRKPRHLPPTRTLPRPHVITIRPPKTQEHQERTGLA